MTVSYLVTVYQKAKFLPTVLAAIAEERAATGGEIIVIDDGSTDGSGRILDDFVATGAGITVVHQANAGVAAGTNRALRAAREPFVRLIDGDDIIAPNSTDALLRAVKASGCGCVYGDIDEYEMGLTYRDLPRADAGGRFEVHPDPLAGMLKSQLFVVSAVLGRREVLLSAVPLPEQYSHQDVSLGLRLATATRIAHVPVLCCSMVSNAASGGTAGRITGSMARMYRDTARITREMLDDWPLKYRGQAVRRSALRALLYARRHIPGSQTRCAALLMIRCLGYLPLPALFPRFMDFVAETYAPALRDPKSFP